MAAERAWKLTRSAFEFFTPEGRFNDRQQAQAVVAAALRHLSGPAWAKTRRLLLRRESFTFLDQQFPTRDFRPENMLVLISHFANSLRIMPSRIPYLTAWANGVARNGYCSG